MIGALHTLIKVKQIDVSFSSFPLGGQFIKGSEKLPLFFLTACAGNWNYAAVNLIIIFFSHAQIVESLFFSTISNFKKSRGIFIKSLNAEILLISSCKPQLSGLLSFCTNSVITANGHIK